MQHLMEGCDEQGDGVIRGPQFNTYDSTMWGANTFIGSYYVCALKCVEIMAGMMNDEEQVIWGWLGIVAESFNGKAVGNQWEARGKPAGRP